MELLFKAFVIALFVFSVIIHEVAHGLVAYRLGDDTAYLKGRITLDPIKHIDLFGTILLPLMLVLSNAGFVFGWAKPVPVNPMRLRRPRKDMLWVALAGPVSNVLLAVMFAIIYHLNRFIFSGGSSNNLSIMLEIALPIVILINLFLAFFNLIPVPPLDGGRIMVGLLPREMAYKLASIERYGMFILIGLIITRAINFVFIPAEWLTNQLLLR